METRRRDARRARDGARWERRWAAGLAVRGIVTAVPFVTAVAAIVVAGRVVPRPEGGPALAGWYAALCTGSWALMWLTHVWLRRLLPLAGLLEMSLLFPERAPSRLRLARRVASRRDLADLRSGAARRPDETTQEAAERILVLVSALRDHDRGTRGHSERVRSLTDLIAARMGLGQDDRDRLRWAALLHDIGKLRVPRELLTKPGAPTPGEWVVLREHPRHGEDLVRPLLSWLGAWGDVVVQHHEKFDGSGYPRGLAGHAICLGARIVAVADAYDVMTAARAYKKPSGRAAALRELVACSGSHFDPDVVRALINVPQGQLLLTMGPISWLTGLPFVGQAPSTLGATLASQTTVAAGAIAITSTAALAPVGLASSSHPSDPRPPAATGHARPGGAPAPKAGHGKAAVPTGRAGAAAPASPPTTPAAGETTGAGPQAAAPEGSAGPEGGAGAGAPAEGDGAGAGATSGGGGTPDGTDPATGHSTGTGTDQSPDTGADGDQPAASPTGAASPSARRPPRRHPATPPQRPSRTTAHEQDDEHRDDAARKATSKNTSKNTPKNTPKAAAGTSSPASAPDTTPASGRPSSPRS